MRYALLVAITLLAACSGAAAPEAVPVVGADVECPGGDKYANDSTVMCYWGCATYNGQTTACHDSGVWVSWLKDAEGHWQVGGEQCGPGC